MRPKYEVELETCLQILKAMQQDIDRIETYWPKSRRGSNGGAAWESLKERIATALACADASSRLINGDADAARLKEAARGALAAIHAAILSRPPDA